MTRRRLHHRSSAPFDRFWYGACYYPEHWDAATRARDSERMAAAGFSLVRMGEFAWDRFEPEPGVYDFALFDETIATLGGHGIRTLLGTPTATPPAWLVRAEPDLLRVDADGRRMEHGSRQHACTANPRYRAHARRIVTALAVHYRDNPQVVGWQTDNELNCHFSECHCVACQTGFRDFLRGEYGNDIAALNAAWGTAFWSQTYRSFDEIATPRDRRPTYQNPHQRLDYLRFVSRATSEFQREQVRILRAHGPQRFIIHNGLMNNLGYRDDGFTTDLDALGNDVYPCFLPPADRFAGQIHWCDRTRAIDGNFIVPEQQMGPGGQNDYLLDTPETGESPQMTWLSIARGADSLLYFRWRSCRFGSEMYWMGILDHDDIPRRRYAEAAEVGAALGRVGPAVLGTAVRVDVAVASQDHTGLCAHRALPMGLPDPEELAKAVHRELTDAGVAAGLVHPDDDLTGLRLFIIPSIAAADPAWAERLRPWVEAGGSLVLTGRTGHHDRRNRCRPDPRPGAFRDLAGVTVAEIGKRNHPEQRPLDLVWNDLRIPAGPWYELLEPAPGTEVVATWAGRHLDGAPAATVRAVGTGRVVYLGALPVREVIAPLLPRLLALAGVGRLWPAAPEQVHVTLREGEGRRLWFCCNRGDGPVTFAAPRGHDLLADRPVDGPLTLERYGTAIIREA